MPGLLDDRRHRLAQLVLSQLPGRDVDSQRQRLVSRTRALPHDRAAAGVAQDPGAERHDQAGLLGQRDELARPEQTALGVLPAHQRLHSDDVLAVDRHLGLEEDAELLALDRLADRVLVVQARQRPLAGDLVEQHHTRAAGALGPVHRGVGVADQVVGILVRIGGDRDADARRGHRLARLQVEGQAERLEHALGHRHRVAVVEDVLAQDHELIAAEPGQRLVAAQGVTDPLGHRLEQLIAGAVAEAVVDHLEAVEVEEQHRHRAVGAAAEALERKLQVVQVEQAAGQSGQRVAQQLVLVRAPGHHVGHAGSEHEPAVDQRPHPGVPAPRRCRHRRPSPARSLRRDRGG